MVSSTEFVGAIVVAPDGQVLCQLRDDYPWIICPGKWCSCPGGRLEEGETPEQAIRREMREEFEIELADLRLMMRHIEPGGEYEGKYFVFVANLATPVSEVKCNEGVKAEFKLPEIAVGLPQHPLSILFTQTYMNQSRMPG